MARFRFDDAGIAFELPITPMLDFTFQLLFFFMMYYNPSALEGQIEMALPKHYEKAAPPNSVPQDVVANETDIIKIPADLTIELRPLTDTSNYGRISTITVKSKNSEDKFSNIDALRPHLKSIREGLTNKEDIKIDSDSRVMLSEFIKVVDACKSEGFKIGVGQSIAPAVGGQ
jgi:biopolymer transport protein ExbD